MNDGIPGITKTKRLVNGMKRELTVSVDNREFEPSYMALCDERRRAERGIVSNMEREFKVIENRIAKGDKTEAQED